MPQIPDMLFSAAKGKCCWFLAGRHQDGQRLIDERVNSPFWKQRQACLSVIWPSNRPSLPDKQRKMSDGGGLYPESTPSSGKLWRMECRFGRNVFKRNFFTSFLKKNDILTYFKNNKHVDDVNMYL
jgi:hypothetical protein